MGEWVEEGVGIKKYTYHDLKSNKNEKGRPRSNKLAVHWYRQIIASQNNQRIDSQKLGTVGCQFIFMVIICVMSFI